MPDKPGNDREESALSTRDNADLKGLASDVALELEQRFGWVVEQIDRMVPNLKVWGGEDGLATILSYLQHEYRDGTIETHDDAVAAVEIYVLRLMAIRLGDVGLAQLKRIQEGAQGILDNKEVWALKSLIETSAKINKTVGEMRQHAGTTRSQRKLLGLTGQGGLQGLLNELDKSADTPEEEDVSIFMRRKLRKPSSPGQGQLGEIVDVEDDLTEERRKFLQSGMDTKLPAGG